MVLLEVKLSAHADTREGMLALLRKTMAASTAELGCVTYRFTADLDDSLGFHLVELWADEAALMGHANGEAFRSFLAELPAVGTVNKSVARQGDLLPYKFARPV